VQPEGDAVSCVLVRVLLDWQAPQAEYVNVVQAAGAGVVAKAPAMASSCAVVRAESDPMPPRLLVIADLVEAAVLPLLLLVARAPWQEMQLLL
jgi:hypothetical protein